MEEEKEEEEQGDDEKYDIRYIQQRNADVELTVTKTKDFDLPPISVEEAVQALELMDHNFYMFRNQVSEPECFLLSFSSTHLCTHLSTCCLSSLRKPRKLTWCIGESQAESATSTLHRANLLDFDIFEASGLYPLRVGK